MPMFSEMDGDFVCPHRNGCPYLQGLPTSWVWENYEQFRESNSDNALLLDQLILELDEAERRNRELMKENALLKVQNQELHRKQFKASKPAAIPEIDAPKPTKKRGAPFGHPGWKRPVPERVDYVIDVGPPSVCPYCQQGNLELLTGTKSHLQEDIVLEPRTVVTKFEHRQAYCTCCKRNVSATGPGEMPGSYIGPVAKSTATYLRYTLGVSFRNITRLFEEFFGLKFVAASALGFDKQAARKGEPLYVDVGNKVRASAVVHADETSWRHDGRSHWVWYGGNEDLAYFQFVQSRSKEAAQSLLGCKFDGILVADGYASYNGVNPMDRQSCLAHLQRKALELEKTISLLPQQLQDPAARSFCRKVADLVGRACHIGRLHREGLLSDKEALIEEKAFRAELARWLRRPFKFPLVETLRKRLAGPEQELFFTFLRHRGVEPTNNQAERSLRPIVIMRKIMQGTRGKIGLENHSVLHTLIQTARRQNTPPRPFLQTLLTSSTSFSQSALYNNDS